MDKLTRIVARGVELWGDTLLLTVCPKCGKENWACSVSTGTCCWCGYDARELLTEEEKENLI
ncbi:MAG: hypothetical protein IKP36_05205 [Bacteroidaceae bacterium]|nr:hypothetical protein [Bacteroidaceae bacterium]